MNDNGFIEIIDTISKLKNINIEVIGSFIWVSGDTLSNKEVLKKLKFRWHKMKKIWYYTNSSYHKRSRKNYTIDELRGFYGSERVEVDNRLFIQ